MEIKIMCFPEDRDSLISSLNKFLDDFGFKEISCDVIYCGEKSGEIVNFSNNPELFEKYSKEWKENDEILSKERRGE